MDADAVCGVDAPRTRMPLTLCLGRLIVGFCKLVLGAAAGASSPAHFANPNLALGDSLDARLQRRRRAVDAGAAALRAD